MKLHLARGLRAVLIGFGVALFASLIVPCGARGQTNYFYGNTANGNWDTTSALWSTPTYSTSSLTQWVNGNNAYVDSGTAATSRTLTLTQDITAQSLLFDARATTLSNYTESYDLAGMNTLNLTSGNLTFNFLGTTNGGVTNNSAGVMNVQIDANLSTAGDLTVNVAGTTTNSSAFGNTTLTLTGVTTFNNLNIYGGYVGPGSARGANTVNIDHNATITGTVNLYGFDGSSKDGASFAVGTTSSNAVTVSANNFVLNPNNVHGTSYLRNDFIARIGAGNSGTTINELDVNGVISGNGDLMFAAGFSGGGGLMVLNQQNTYLGYTMFNAGGSTSSGLGVVQLGIDNAIPTGSPLIWGFNTNGNGGTLDLNGHNQTVSSLWTQFGAGSSVITNNESTGLTTSTLTIAGSDSPGAFALPINDGSSGGKVALVRSGTGTTLLTNSSSTYSGGTSLLGGVLSVSADHILGSPPSVATPANLVISGGALAVTGVGFNLSSNRGIALGPMVGSGNGTINVSANGNLSYNGIIDNNGLLGTGGLILSGAGMLTLGGANTYTGPTAINQGTLSLAQGGSLNALSTVTIAAGATLAGSGTANGSVVVNGAVAPGSTAQVGQLDVGSLTLSGGGVYNWKLFNAPGAAGNDWDLISVGATGTGVVTLNNTQANPFTINVTAPPGGLINFVDTQSYTWQILGAGSFVGGPYNASLFNVNTSAFPAGDPGSTIALSNSGGNLSLVYTPGPTPLIWKQGTGGPGTWSNDAGATDWTSGPWTPGAVAAFNNGTGNDTVMLQAPITAAGLQFNTGGYTIAGSGANTITAPSISVTNGGDTVTISAQIVGANLTMRGTGTLVLAGPNSYTGTTTIASGTLQGNTTSLPTDIIDNGTLIFAQTASDTFSHNLSGGGLIVVQNQNNSVLTLGGTNSSTGFVKINSGALSVDSDARLGTSNSVMLNGGTLRTSTGFSTARTINVGDPVVLSPANGTLDTMGNTVVLNGGTGLAPQILLNNTSTFHKVGTGELQVTTSGFTYGGGLNTSGLVEVDQGTLTVGLKSAGTSPSNPATFFGPTGFSNGLALMDGTTFTDAASTTGNASFNSLSSLSVSGSATFQIYRTLTSDSGLSQSPALTIDGNRATPLTLNGTLTVNGDGNLAGATPRLTVGALTLTGDSTLQMVTNQTTSLSRLYSTNFTESGLIVDNGHTLTFGAGGNATNSPGSGIFLNAVAGNNVVTGNWIIGNPAGTNGVTVSVGGGDNLSFTSGSITVNPFGQLSLFQAFTYGTVGQTLTLNGIGAAKSSFSAGTAGALLTTSGKNTTYIGNVALASNSIIDVPGSSANPPVGSLTLKGTISGPGLLQKQGTGNLMIFGVNTSNENVLVGNGTVTVGNGDSGGFGAAVMPMGNLTLGEQPTTDTVSSSTGFTAVSFRNVAQTIGNLASSFAAATGTISQTVMLTGTDQGGTVLTINETSATTFGPGAVSTLTSTITGAGSIVLGGASTGTLTFTGTNNYNGGTTINGGKLALAGGTKVGAIYGGDVAINANGIVGVNTAANLVAGNPFPPTGANTNSTALINLGGTMSIDSDFDAGVLVDPASVGILALNTNNSTLSGTNGSSAFIGAFGSQSLTTTTLAPGAGNTYRLGGRGGTLTVSNGVLSDSAGPVSNSLLVGSIQPNGSGTVVLAAMNSFTGGTTVNNGTLQTTADGSLGSGALVVNAAAGAVSLASVQSNETVSRLSSAVSGGGTANLTVAAGKTLTSSQSANTTFQGTLGLTASATAHAGGTLSKSGNGTLEVDGAPALGANSNVNINDGTLKFKVNSGSAFVGTGVLLTVTGTANLELAGSVSALDPLVLKSRADISNNSLATAGVLVSGTNQQVGSIDGNGVTQVNAGSDLAANHIVQSALVIGGSLGNPGRITIDASDSNGNPLASEQVSGGLVIADSVSGGGPFGSGSTNPVLAAGAIQSGDSVGIQWGAGEGLSANDILTTVPEPSSILLSALGALALGFMARRKPLLDSRD